MNRRSSTYRTDRAGTLAKRIALLFVLTLPVLGCLPASALALNLSVPLGGDVIDAVAAVGDSGGGTVTLAAGTYTLPGVITVNSNTTIVGQGPSTILQASPLSPGSIVQGASANMSNITIENLVMDGQVHRNTVGAGIYGGACIFMFASGSDQINNVTISGVTVHDCGEGMQLGQVDGLNLTDDTFVDNNPEGNFAHDVYLVACWSVTIDRSTFDYSNADGVHMDFQPLGGDLIENSDFSHDGGFGILLQGNIGLLNILGGIQVHDTITNFDGDDGIQEDSYNSLFQGLEGSYDGGFALNSQAGSGLGEDLYGFNDGGGFPPYNTYAIGLASFLISGPTPNLYPAAESASVVGPAASANWSSAYNGDPAGLGAVDFSGYPNGSLTFDAGATAAGATPSTIEYSNGSAATETLGLSVNGQPDGTVSFPPTGSSTTWATASVSLPMTAGNNTVTLRPQTGSASPAIDFLQVDTPTPAAPGAPTNLTATVSGPYQTDLNWTAGTGAQSYTIQRNGAVIATDVYATHYADQTIGQSGQAASYVVTATNQGGSTASGSVTATMPPDAPQLLSYSAGSTANTITWLAVTGATSYNVKRSTTEGGPYTTIGSTDSTSYTDSTVSAGTTYYYVVSSVGAGGEGPHSAEEGSQITPVQTYAGDGQVTIAWSGPQVSQAGGTATVTASPGGQSCTATTSTACTVTGLTNGQTYRFTINEGGRIADATATPYPQGVMSAADGMSLWLDASDPSTVYTSPSCQGQTATAGQAVGCIVDKSGSGESFSQWTPASQPTLGTEGDLPALDFANAAQTQSLDSRDALDTYRTVVIATDMQSTASGADELFGQQGADFGIRHYNGSAYPQGTLADPNSADWASGTGATPQEWTDGTQATEPTIGTPQIITDVSAQPQTIAAAIGDYALSRGLVGTIGEIVAFKGTLSTAARDAVQAYLAQKWGASDSANAAFAPVIVTQPTATTVTAGQTATLTAGAAAIPAASVQWQTTTNGGTTWVSDTTDGGATTGTLTVADASVALSGAQYRAVFNNSQGTATSSPAVLTVVGPPSVTTQPAAETINVGQTATFQAAVSANPAATSTQWQVSTDGGSTWHDDTTDAGATTDTLTVAGATAAENGYEYRLAITNTIGETITNPVRLTVRYAPVITTQPVAATIALGQTATFTIAVSGSPTPSIQWRISFNSGQSYNTLPGANAPSFSVTNAVAGQNGALLDAVVSNSLGTVTSAPALLTIANPPGNTAPPTISGTPQDGLVLTRSGRGTWTSGSALTYADQWERCDSAGTQCTAIAGATGVVYRAKSADVGHELTVAVTATDRLGQSATATATPTAVVADPPPPVNTGRPSVSGTPQEGLVLTRASTGTWSSVDTLSFTDQWERCDPNGLECAPIAGATGIVYRARSADVGSTIALAVTATDKEGQKMTATSAPTAAVSAS